MTSVGALSSTTALAQDQTDAGLGDIIVTATKRGDEKLQDIPISISATSSMELKNFGIRNLSGIDLKSPGLIVTNNGMSGQTYIRGIGDEFANPGLEPPVSVYVDGVYDGHARGNIADMLDVDVVQVLKGPQGTLYGRNATGGAVVISTKKPEMTNSLSGSFEAGNLNYVRVESIANAALSDQFAVRIAGRYSDVDGHVHNPFTKEKLGGYHGYDLVGKALYSGSVVTAMLTVQQTRDAGFQGLRQQKLPAPFCTACQISGVAPATGKYETYQRIVAPDSFVRRTTVALNLDANLGDMTLSSMTAYRKHRVNTGTDEGTMGSAPGGFLLSGSLVELQTAEDWQQELRLASSFDGAINFLLGVNGYYTNERIVFTRISDTSPVVLATDDNVKTRSASVFGELYWDVADKIKVTVGGRYSYDKKKGVAVVDSDRTNPTNALTGFSTNDSWSNFTPRAVIAFTPNSDSNYYLSYTKGFKSGGPNFPAFSRTPDVGPATIDSYEVGAKNAFMGGRLRTNLAVFFYKYNNIQVSVVGQGSTVLTKVNAGAAEGYGGEFDMRYALADGLELGAGYSYLHAQFTDYQNARVNNPTPTGFVNLTVDLSNTPLSRAPKHTMFGSLNYGFDVGSGWKINLNGIIRYTSSFEFQQAAGGPLRADVQPAYEMVNLSGTLARDDDSYSIGFFVRNATNSYYYVNRATNPTGAYAGAAQPRTYGISASFKL
jgi:iron complex outermembrane receptor protein